MYCKNCGNKILNKEANFCNQCGKPISHDLKEDAIQEEIVKEEKPNKEKGGDFWEKYKLKNISLEIAEKHIKGALIAGLICLGLTIALLLFGIFPVENWFDVAFIFLLLIGLYRKNTFSAVGLLVYFFAAKIFQIIEGDINFIVVAGALVFLHYFYLGALGVIKYNKLIKKEKSTKKGIIFGIIIGIIATILLGYGFYYLLKESPTDNKLGDISSVVNIFCPFSDQEFSLESTGTGGSGTIIDSEGIIITNSHIIPQDKDFLDINKEGCFVVLPESETGKPSEIYLANPVVIPELSDDYDLAWFEIYDVYTDPKDGYVYGQYPKKFPVYDDTSLCVEENFKLGESVRVYGYPVSTGGYSLTITEGVISSFLEDGLIAVSAKIDEGNSGGLAIDKNGCMVGIPAMVSKGTYENMGIIIPTSLVIKFFDQIQSQENSSSGKSNLSECSAGMVKSGNECITRNQYCKEQYDNSTSIFKNSRYICTCMEGYEWNNIDVSKATACVIPPPKTNEQICQDDYGINSVWSGQTNSQGGLICGCRDGYVWNSAQTACVSIVESRDQSCASKYPNTSFLKYDQVSGKSICDCKTGYYWNNEMTACYSQTSFNQSCINSYGQGSYSTTQNGKRVCDCLYGYAWNPLRNACVTVSSINAICEKDVGRNSRYAGSSSNGKYNCTAPY